MNRLTKTVWTETGHRLLGYKGLCSNVHGHSYKWDITIQGDVSEKTGFVLDFKDLKRVLSDTVLIYDHAFVICDNDPLINVIDTNLIVLPYKPSVENMIRHIIEPVKTKLSALNVDLISIRTQETVTSYAEVIL